LAKGRPIPRFRPNEFRQLYTEKLQQIGRQFGRPLTMDQARTFGLDRQLLQQTIAEATLDEEGAPAWGLDNPTPRPWARDLWRSEFQGASAAHSIRRASRP